MSIILIIRRFSTNDLLGRNIELYLQQGDFFIFTIGSQMPMFALTEFFIGFHKTIEVPQEV